MGKRAPSPPPAPDPVATAQAQGAANRETAISQATINMVNQRTPFGALTYNQIGTAADGTPRYEAVTTLTPEQQRLFQIGQDSDLALANIGRDQIDRVGGVLSQPVDLSNEAVEGRIMELANTRQRPALEQRRAAEETRLANQGVLPGSEAYRRAMEAVTQGENDALNQLLLGARQQAIQETLTARNQPLNEISALLSGAQIGLPQFQPTPQTQVAPTDVMGPVYQNYAGAMNAYNQRIGQQNAQRGALFGLAGQALGGWASGGFAMSDRRLKRDVRRIGTTPGGAPLYRFRYVWGGPEVIGVMAQDMLAINPAAVREIGGYLAVDYGRVA